MRAEDVARRLREDPCASRNVVAHQLAVRLEMTEDDPAGVLLEGILMFCRREAVYHEELMRAQERREVTFLVPKE